MTFHFFTDTNLLTPQDASDAFGPQGTDGTGHDVYRLSSMHCASSDPTAYAICSGIVCAQEIPGTSPELVNLILKPLDRPPLNFVPIRYYIYKGILKDSLFNGTAIAAPSTNDLTQAIWDSQNRINEAANTPNAQAPAAALGIDLTAALDAVQFADASPIDNLYFRAGVTAQLPVVAGGWRVGKFAQAGFGLSILLDDLGPRHELALTRSLDDYHRVATLTGAETADQLFAHWHAKEKVLRFMDPCAFYGSFYGDRLRVKTSTGTFEVKKGDSIYTDVVAHFHNSNTAYLDIRNEHNNSFNYFNNYSRQIEIAFDGTAQRSPLDYYAEGWPILRIVGTRFAAANTNSFNVLRVALPAGDNSRPLFYVSQGYKSAGSAAFPKPLTWADKIARPNVQNGLTDEVALALPNVASATSAQPVASYTRLKYFKSFDANQAAPQRPPTTVVAANYLDNVFYPVELQTTFGGTSPVKSAVYDEEIYVDAMTDLGIEFIGKVGVAVDNLNVTFFAFPSFIIAGDAINKTVPLSIVGEVFDPQDPDEPYLNLLLANFPENGLKVSPITPNPPEGLVRTMSVVARAATDGRFTVPNFGHFIALVFDKPAYNAMLARAAMAFLASYRVYLSVKNGVPHPNANNVTYTTNEIELRGYALTGGAITVTETKTDSTSGFTTNVKVYSK